MPDPHKIRSDVLTDIEESYKDQLLEDADIDELKSIHQDIIRVKSDLFEILQNKTDRAIQLFRHNLLIIGALIAAFSFLIQGNVIEPTRILNNKEILISFSLLFTSLLFSSIAYIPIPWKKDDFKSIYETDDVELSESKEKIQKRIKQEKILLNDMRDVINMKDLALSISVLTLIGSFAILALSVRDALSLYQQIFFLGPFTVIGTLFILYSRRL